MTTYKCPQSIRIASGKLSPDTLHDICFALTVLIVIYAVKLVKPRSRTIVLRDSLDLNSEEVISSVSLPSLKKTRRFVNFATRRFVWANCIAYLYGFAYPQCIQIPSYFLTGLYKFHCNFIFELRIAYIYMIQ